MPHLPQSVFATFGLEADRLASLTVAMSIAGAVIFLAVALLFAHALRARGGSIGHRGGMRLVLWAGAVIPTILLATLLIATLPAMRPLRAAPGDLVVRVEGEQFWWRMRYEAPGREAVEDANRLRLPAGRTVTLLLSSGDVLHSFWVPGLAGKLDMVPGRVNRLVVRAEAPGRYRGQCAEFCGLSHALMALEVEAMPPAVFDAWLAGRADPRPAGTGLALFDRHGCAGCHALSPDGARIGPDLSRLAERHTLGAASLPMTEANLIRFIRDAPGVKPGARMPAYPQLTPAEARAIARMLMGQSA